MNRIGFIGGSDISAVLGLSKFKTPYQTYLEKIGESPELSKYEHDFFMRRKLAEKYIIEVYSSIEKTEIIHRNEIHIDNEYDFFRSEIDFDFKKDNIFWNGEAKSISIWDDSSKWGESFTDFIPKDYLLQVQWGLMCSGRDKCNLIAMKGFDDFRQYYIYRNDELISHLRDEALKFWDNVQNKIPPNPSTVKDFELKGCNNRPVEADDYILSMINRKKNLDLMVDELDNVKDEIKKFIGENETLMYKGDVLATWKEQSTTRGDFLSLEKSHPDIAKEFKKTTKSRTLRIK
jgi:predicted phage-related endonuclease